MSYNKRPEMILFDVGGTLFDDGKCIPTNGFEALRLSATNPEVTTAEEMAKYWDKYLAEVSGIKSQSGGILDIPLSAVIRYATMNTGLRFQISMAEQEEIFDRFNSTREILDGTKELLSALNNMGIRTAVISNNMMSGDSLDLAIKHWLPSSDFEFCLTSADILFTKPCEDIFRAAMSYAGLEAEDCWYCGDSFIPDVLGSSRCGMTPVLIDTKSSAPIEYKEVESGTYLVVNNWHHLTDFLKNL